MASQRLCGIRGRVEELCLLTGEGESVRLGIYGANQRITVDVGRHVADGLRLGDEIQVWLEKVASHDPGNEGGER